MPRKYVRRQKRVEGHVTSHELLAEALGVHRNTIGAWARRGAPTGPPYSVVEWFAWAKAKGYQVHKPRADSVRELLDVDEDTEPKPNGADELPGSTPYDQLWLTGRMKLETAREREQLKADMILVEQRQVQLDSAKVAHDKERAVLIPKDDAAKAATIVFNAFLREGALLADAVVQALAKQPHSVRALASAAVKDAWTGVLERVGKDAPDARG